VAFSVLGLRQTEAHVINLDVTEIERLPPYVLTPPPPPPPPPPDKEPSVPLNQLETVRHIRAKYPVPLGAQHPAFLIEVANATGGKLFRKDGGAHVTLPNGVNVSMDILIVPSETGPWWVDILGDAEGAAEPVWDAHPNAGGEFVDVSGMGSVPDDPPPPPPPPAVCDWPDQRVEVAQLRDEVAHLGRRVAQLEAKRDDLTHQLEEARRERDEARREVERLQSQPDPSCEAEVPGWLRRLGVRVGCRIVR
jgi:hypothetical protein